MSFATRQLTFRASVVLVLSMTFPLSLIPVDASGPEPWGELHPSGAFYTEKSGFRYLRVQGTPSEIGYQHGCVLADLIVTSVSAYAHATERSYGLDWSQVRRHGMTYWRYVPDEQREEIDGIVLGASENGARNPLGDPVDRWDILALNAIWDIWWRMEPPGNVWWWLPWSTDLPSPESNPPHHCSAFVATGDATADGGFVLGQSLWMPYFLSPAHAVFMDIIPETGNRIFMEVTAGMIWSGTEYYINSAGLVAAETTLGVGAYQWGGVPSFIRLRRAVQYADSIDGFTDIMLESTNGAYCGDYLLADAKTNEVAVLELGSHEWALRRTTNGFLPSCNYPWDEAVANEMGAPQGWDHGCYPRWVRLEQLRDRDYGNITVFHGMEYLGDHYDTVKNMDNPCSHTLCGHVENDSGYPHGSIDAKVTNRTMTLRMELWARFGHSCGRPFLVEDQRRDNPEYVFDDLVDIIPQPYASFSSMEGLIVRVKDGSGDPVQNAEVVLRSTVDGAEFIGVTGTGGEVTFEFLPFSEYSVSGRSGGLSGSIIAEHDEEEEIELVLKDNGSGGGSGVLGPGTVLVLVLIIAAGAGIAVMIKLRNKGTRSK